MGKPKIEFSIHKELNFFRIIKLSDRINKRKDYKKYRINSLSFKIPVKMKITEEDEKVIKKFFRNQKNNSERIMEFPELKKIYDKNKEYWEAYWNKNLGKLKETKENLREEFEKFDLSIFDNVARFFEAKSPKKIKITVCMGNNTKLNPNFVRLYNNLIISFPREFYKQPQGECSREISAIIHEIVHLCQDWCGILMKNRDIDFLEKTAACFASKGILINEDKVERQGKSLEFYNTIKNAFKKGKTISNIRNKLEELRDFEYYN